MSRVQQKITHHNKVFTGMCTGQTYMITQVFLGQNTSLCISVVKFLMSLMRVPLGTCFGEVRGRDPHGYLRDAGDRELRRVKESQVAKEGRVGLRSSHHHFPTTLKQNPFLGFITPLAIFY